MNNFLLSSYYKITDVINSCEVPEHIVCANNMYTNLCSQVDHKIEVLRSKVFGWEFWKWIYNYREYNRFLELSQAIKDDLSQLLQECVKQYNKAVEEAQKQLEIEERESMYKVTVVRGFQKTPPPKKKKRRGKKNDNIIGD